MLYGTETDPYPAYNLHVGDLVRQPSGSLVAVTNIETVYRKGVYAPFTYSGKLVVNGVVLSAYTFAIDFGVPISQHWISHLSQVPHRLYTRLGGRAESYTEGGLSSYASGLYKITMWWMQQHIAVGASTIHPCVLLICGNDWCGVHDGGIMGNDVDLILLSCPWFQPYRRSVVGKH
jgi:hypothetical protein